MKKRKQLYKYGYCIFFMGVFLDKFSDIGYKKNKLSAHIDIIDNLKISIDKDI